MISEVCKKMLEIINTEYIEGLEGYSIIRDTKMSKNMWVLRIVPLETKKILSEPTMISLFQKYNFVPNILIPEARISIAELERRNLVYS